MLVLCTLFLASCTTIKQHNENLVALKSVESLNSDVDYIYAKLQKMHPKLYWYITKEKFDFKIDSLKKSISKPMTSLDFYKKLAPVIKTIGQGHLSLTPGSKQFTKDESKALVKKGIGPFSQFDLEIFNDKLYVVKNKSYDKKIKVGTELVAINGQKTNDLIKKYKTWFASDGYNTTFLDRVAARRIGTYFTVENGIQEKVDFDFKFNDSLKTTTINRGIVDSVKLDKNKKPIVVKTTRDERKAKAKKNDFYGYNAERKLFNRNFKFTEKDSVTAIMKINGFSIGGYRKFYENSFLRLKNNNTKTLIIDLRDNGGGRLAEIEKLYSYLALEDFIFQDKVEVVSKTSMFKREYFKGGSIGAKILKLAGATVLYPYMYFNTKKDVDNKYYYGSLNPKPQKINENAFKGKIYVLINGGSFSASSIISSNLKGSKRAFFVGQETGGGYNGTVAGQMPIVTLPASNIKAKIGLMADLPHYKTEVIGHGIYPDKKIIPTIQDRISGKDPEMEWILEEIKK